MPRLPTSSTPSPWVLVPMGEAGSHRCSWNIMMQDKRQGCKEETCQRVLAGMQIEISKLPSTAPASICVAETIPLGFLSALTEMMHCTVLRSTPLVPPYAVCTDALRVGLSMLRYCMIVGRYAGQAQKRYQNDNDLPRPATMKRLHSHYPLRRRA